MQIEVLERAAPAGAPSPTGDCVDCARCVTVCPTGIDIRNGIQLECVNCTACMDACDDVMDRLCKGGEFVLCDFAQLRTAATSS